MPDMPLPLHIFEERYKKMIGECLEQNKEFGIVYISGDELRQVGCTAKIVEVLQRYEGGEMDIITLGRNRFFIKEVYDAKPYFEARVIHFDDVPEEESGELLMLAREGIESLRALDRVIGIPRDYEELKALGAKPVSFLISGSDGLPLEEKQELLEMTSTRGRLKSGLKSIQQVLDLRDVY
jgi:Lon protease-like protein